MEQSWTTAATAESANDKVGARTHERTHAHEEHDRPRSASPIGSTSTSRLSLSPEIFILHSYSMFIHTVYVLYM